MAILKCHWKLDEGSGLVAADSSSAGYHNDGAFTTVGGYPKWVTAYNGKPAVENDGTFIGYTGLKAGPRIVAPLETLYDLGCETKFDYWSLYAKAMLPVSSFNHPRGILVISDNDFLYMPDRCAAALYHGYGGVVGFGIIFYISQTAHSWGIATSADMRDGKFHEYLAIWDNSFASVTEKARMRLFVDGIEVATRIFDYTATMNNYIQGSEISLGWGPIGNGNIYGEDFPGTSKWDTQTYGGSMYGQLQEARFYCGAVNPNEVFPPKISSIMFSCNT